jgi:hypothetical protein
MRPTRPVPGAAGPRPRTPRPRGPAAATGGFSSSSPTGRAGPECSWWPGRCRAAAGDAEAAEERRGRGRARAHGQGEPRAGETGAHATRRARPRPWPRRRSRPLSSGGSRIDPVVRLGGRWLRSPVALGEQARTRGAAARVCRGGAPGLRPPGGRGVGSWVGGRRAPAPGRWRVADVTRWPVGSACAVLAAG